MKKADFLIQIHQISKSMKPFAMNMTRNVEDAEDLIQDTLLRAINNIDKFQDGTNIKAWLYTIMKNIFINNYRKRSRLQIVNDESDTQFLLQSNGEKTFNIAERKWLSDELDVAMNQVDASLRQPFQMYYEGAKYEEIATVLDVPLGTVKSRIFLARKRMQHVLQNRGIDTSYKIAS